MKPDTENNSIQDVCRCRWSVSLPTHTVYPIHKVELSVIYESGQMDWYYQSTVTQEAGRMGRYEDDDYFLHEEHSESEFSSREELIQRLMDFIPDCRRNPWHGMNRNPQADMEIRNCLDMMFRNAEQEISRSSARDEKTIGPSSLMAEDEETRKKETWRCDICGHEYIDSRFQNRYLHGTKTYCFRCHWKWEDEQKIRMAAVKANPQP